MMLSPEFQCWTDYREEGCFLADQYAEGSALRKRYEEEMVQIKIIEERDNVSV